MIYQVRRDDGAHDGPKKPTRHLHAFKTLDAHLAFVASFDPNDYPGRVRTRLTQVFYLEQVTYHNET